MCRANLVDFRKIVKLVDRIAFDIHRLGDRKEAHIRRALKDSVELLLGKLFAEDLESDPTRIHHTNGLHDALLERATDSHDFTD